MRLKKKNYNSNYNWRNTTLRFLAEEHIILEPPSKDIKLMLGIYQSKNMLLNYILTLV